MQSCRNFDYTDTRFKKIYSIINWKFLDTSNSSCEDRWFGQKTSLFTCSTSFSIFIQSSIDFYRSSSSNIQRQSYFAERLDRCWSAAYSQKRLKANAFKLQIKLSTSGNQYNILSDHLRLTFNYLTEPLSEPELDGNRKTTSTNLSK